MRAKLLWVNPEPAEALPSVTYKPHETRDDNTMEWTYWQVSKWPDGGPHELSSWKIRGCYVQWLFKKFPNKKNLSQQSTGRQGPDSLIKLKFNYSKMKFNYSLGSQQIFAPTHLFLHAHHGYFSPAGPQGSGARPDPHIVTRPCVSFPHGARSLLAHCFVFKK